MIRICGYDKGIVEFYCENCDKYGEFNVSNLLTNNCAVDIPIVCEECQDYKVLYVLRCDNLSVARELNAQLEVLRVKRGEGGTNNGCQDTRSEENKSVQSQCC